MNLSIQRSKEGASSLFLSVLGVSARPNSEVQAKEMELIDAFLLFGMLVGGITTTIGLIGCKRNFQSHLLVRKAYQAIEKSIPQQNFFSSIDGIMAFGGGIVAWGSLLTILYRGIISNQYGWMKTFE